MLAYENLRQSWGARKVPAVYLCLCHLRGHIPITSHFLSLESLQRNRWECHFFVKFILSYDLACVKLSVRLQIQSYIFHPPTTSHTVVVLTMTGESQGSLRAPTTQIQYDLAQGTDAHLVPHHLLPISSRRFQSLPPHNCLNHLSYSPLRTPQHFYFHLTTF